MPETGFEIHFLDSFRADTAVIPEVIDHLIADLRAAGYPQDEIDEVVLSMDEAITNAVQETISKQQNVELAPDSARREITVRYTVSPECFDATVIDHGKGLDIERMLRTIPDSNSGDYHEQIFDYVKSAEQKKLQVRLNGREIILNGIGAGLKIMLTFMDNVSIDLIDKKSVLATNVTEFTDGTILNMRRTRRY